ncbi:PAS domain-containing protein [Neotamlana laminarinivorans]|uniref:histidine kinase n=1 Tax=Neotamlana laminarinivorans TaxID=2883124 RepID=A0A9X1HWX8_9FLAO|nr:PAS domain-containing protein [Tamlana laminarinivorans]MCB4797410.1 PAS domain-containing protein [Tamlana laminarinivorans]
MSEINNNIEVVGEENLFKVFIEQSPSAVAILDKNMVYLAASFQWLKDYKKEKEDVVGKSHYDIFPEIGDDWKLKHQECLNGAIDVCEEAPFKRADGSVQWISWDVRPWYNSEGKIGGLIMYTGDVTEKRNKRIENERNEYILAKTEKLSKIGTWELDLNTGEYTLNEMSRKLLELPEDYKTDASACSRFYNSDSQNINLNAIATLIETGESFDLEIEMITYKGNSIWVRKIGEAEFINNECIRVFGLMQDITENKLQEIQIKKRNIQLNRGEKIANLGYWSWKPESNTRDWSDNMYEITGFTGEFANLQPVELLNLVIPEDYQGAKEHMDKAFNQKQCHDGLVMRIKTPHGKIKTTRVLAEFIINEKGEICEVVGTMQDISELVQVENKFKSLLQSAPSAMIIADSNGCIQIINRQAEKIFGYKPSELIGKPVEVLMPTNKTKKHQNITKFYFENPKGIYSYSGNNVVGKDKTGRVFPIELSINPLQTEGGVLVSVAIRDITKQKEAEKETLQKNEMLSFAEDLAKIGNWEWHANSNEIYWSNGLYKILDLSNEDYPEMITASYYLNFVHPDDKAFLSKKIEEILNLKKTEDEFVYRLITKTGREIIVETKCKIVYNSSTNKIDVIKGTTQDISRDKKIEQEITQKNKMLNFAESFAKMGSWEIDLLTDEIFWSDGMFELLDIEDRNQTLTYDYYYSFVHPDDLSSLKKTHEVLHDNQQFSKKEEHRIISAKGYLKTIISNGEAVLNDKGEIVKIKGVAKDVTQEREIQQEVIQKNQMLSFAENLAMLGNWEWDAVTDEFIWSDGLYIILGVKNSIKNMSTRDFFNYVHPDDKEYLKMHIKQFMHLKKIKETLVYRIVTPKGKIKVVHSKGNIFTNQAGDVIKIKGTTQDVTKQKAIAEEILQKNKMLSYAEDLALMGNWYWNIETNELTWSSGKDKILELKKPLKDKSFEVYLNKFVHPDDTDYVTNRVEQIFQDKSFGEVIEHRIITENKNVKIIHLLGEVVTNTQEEIIFMKGTCQDVTKQYETQKLIERKNEMLSYAENLALIGNWQWFIGSNEIIWSDGIYKILDIDDKTQKITINYYLSFVHPEDKKYVYNILERKLIKKDFSEPIEHRMITKKGLIKTVYLLGNAEIDSNGKVMSIKGTCQDITQQKKSKQEILHKNELLSQAESIGLMGSWQLNLKTFEAEWSEGLCDILEVDYKTQQFSFQHYLKFVHHDDRSHVIKMLEKAILEKTLSENIEHRVITALGSIKYVDILAEVVLNDKGEPYMANGTCQDITKQKEEELIVLETNKNLEILAEELTKQNTQLSDFAQITSHNLRAPVSNLNSLLELYHYSDNLEEKRLLFEKFDTVVGHLTSTLNTLVNALKTKSSAVKREIIYFNDVLNTTKNLLFFQISENKVIINSDFEEVEKISYNRDYIESIFLNLMENAIKYKAPNRTPIIDIYTKINENGSIKLIIKDNGLGINLNRHGKKIFGLNQVFHKHPEAKGVGLFMTKTQIESMGGSIFVSSEVDEGTTFVINF